MAIYIDDLPMFRSDEVIECDEILKLDSLDRFGIVGDCLPPQYFIEDNLDGNCYIVDKYDIDIIKGIGCSAAEAVRDFWIREGLL